MFGSICLTPSLESLIRTNDGSMCFVYVGKWSSCGVVTSSGRRRTRSKGRRGNVSPVSLLFPFSFSFSEDEDEDETRSSFTA